MHRTCTDRRYHVELFSLAMARNTFSFIFFPFTALCTARFARARFSPFASAVSFSLSLSTYSGLTFRRFTLSSVVFIVCDVDDEVADDEVYSDAPRSSGPAGRPSQSECLISYFGFSYFAAPRSTSFFS